MRALLVLVIISCFCWNTADGQQASDVLERGITIKQNQKLFLKYEAGVLKYDIAEDRPDNYLTLPDSALFLPKNIGVNVYMRPLNPVNFSVTNEVTFVPDQIEAKATEVFDQITGLLGKMDKNWNETILKYKKANANQKEFYDNPPLCWTQYNNLKLTYFGIKEKLDSGNVIQKQIISSFNLLEALTFEESLSTRDSIDLIGKQVSEVEVHFDSVKTLLDLLKTQVKKYSCNDFADSLIVKHVFKDIIKELTDEYDRQKVRYQNLKNVLDLVDKACKEASVSKDGYQWYVFIKEVEVQRGKISKLAVKVNQSGYVLVDGEIVANKLIEKVNRVISFRKFNLFIPEVSAGVAYTNLNFPKYSTEADSLGQQYVADAGNENFKRLSINAMLNIVGFIPNSMVQPFFQLGVGVNANYPTILTGIGLRLNFVPLKRLALSFGCASTWIQQLDKLKVGDKVSGEAEVSKDLKYQFNWPPKPYIGIQYNF